MEIEQYGNIMPTEKRENPNVGRVYNKDALCPCLSTMQGGNRQPFIIVEVEDEE